MTIHNTGTSVSRSKRLQEAADFAFEECQGGYRVTKLVCGDYLGRTLTAEELAKAILQNIDQHYKNIQRKR